MTMDDIIALLRNFNGREYSGPIEPETYFFADLGMASIDAVVFAEMLEQYYGQKFPFKAFMAKQHQRAMRDMQLYELAEFLEQNLKNEV